MTVDGINNYVECRVRDVVDLNIDKRMNNFVKVDHLNSVFKKLDKDVNSTLKKTVNFFAGQIYQSSKKLQSTRDCVKTIVRGGMGTTGKVSFYDNSKIKKRGEETLFRFRLVESEKWK